MQYERIFLCQLRTDFDNAKKQMLFTEKSAADILGNLVSGFAWFGKLAEFFVEHSFKLQRQQTEATLL